MPQRIIIIQPQTVQIDTWDDESNWLNKKIVGGAGIEVALARRDCPALIVKSTVGKHFFVTGDNGNSGQPVPPQCGTIVVDSTTGPVQVVLADPSLRNSIKRVTVIVTKLIYPVDVISETGPVYDTDHVHFEVEGASYTFGAVNTDPTTPDDPTPNPQPTPDPWDRPDDDFSAGPSSGLKVIGIPDDTTNMPGTWVWYPVGRYIPGFVY